ncbi:hypothetical protein E4T56_gene19018 [Termitomyces sp. T112]|nr:hypothetical protein E4T56_gene19018 [Termitomyces sp. T112]
MGQLHPLPIPAARWSVASVDFIVELQDAHGYDAVMVVVDLYGKRAHFIPTHTTCSALGAASLYWKNVWKLHEFTQKLYHLLGVKLHTTTAYHPQSVEQYLRLFCNERQDDWDELLPDAEFQYNNHVHSSTQMTPFFLDTGQHPCMGFEPQVRPSENGLVNKFVDRMKKAQEEAKVALVKAREDMAWYYDWWQTPAPMYKPGDRMYLDSSDIKTTRPSQKLSHRHLGPFVVEKKVGPLAYRLKLPAGLHRLHPVFNVVKLFPALDDPIPGHRPNAPPPPVLVNNEEEYEVEEILDSRMFRGRLQFKVKWKGYGIEDISWEPQASVHAPALIRDFYHRHPNAPKAI